MDLPGTPWYLKETLDILYQIYSKISDIAHFTNFGQQCLIYLQKSPLGGILRGFIQIEIHNCCILSWYSQIWRLRLSDCLRSPKYWSTWIFPLIHENVLLPVHWSFSPMRKCETYSRVCFLFVFAMRIGEGKTDGQRTCSSGVWWCLCCCCF